MPSGIPYSVKGVIRSHFMIKLQGHLDLCVQSHKSVPSIMELQYHCHYYLFLPGFFPSFPLRWANHGMPSCSPIMLRRRTWWYYHVFNCCWNRLIFHCMAAMWRTWQIIRWVLFTLPYITRGHETSMFLLQSDYRSDSLKFLSCDCQRGPSWGL